MDITDEDILINTGEETIAEVTEEIKNLFVKEVSTLGHFRPRMILFSEQTHKRILEVSVRDVKESNDKNLALVEATSLAKVCGTSNGIFFYDDVFTDEITEENTEAIVMMAFTEKGLMITFLPYEQTDAGINFGHSDMKALDFENAPSEIISTLAFSIASDEQSYYARDYIEVLIKRGHDIRVLEEDEVYEYAYPI